MGPLQVGSGGYSSGEADLNTDMTAKRPAVRYFSGPSPESISQNVLHRPSVQGDVNRRCVQKGSLAEGVKNTKLKPRVLAKQLLGVCNVLTYIERAVFLKHIWPQDHFLSSQSLLDVIYLG